MDGSEWKKADDQKLKAERKQQLRDDESDKKIEERAAPGEAWLWSAETRCARTPSTAPSTSTHSSMVRSAALAPTWAGVTPGTPHTQA